MKRLGFLTWFLVVGLCSGAEMDEALREDASEALEKLEAVRAEISERKIELSKRVSAVEEDLLELRRKAKLARMSAAAREADERKLRREVGVYEKDAKYLEGILRDYAVAEGLPAEGNLVDRVEVIGDGLDRLEEALGGRRLAGEVVTRDGRVLSGEIAEVGPARWFLGEDVAGAVIDEKGKKMGTVLEGDQEAIEELFSGKEAMVEVDVTGGKAIQIQEVQDDSVGTLLAKGGVWLWPILGVALVSAFCAVMKMIQLMGIRRPTEGWVGEILESLRGGDDSDAESLARRVRHPAGDLLGDAVGYVGSGAEVVEEVVYERLIGVQGRLQKWLTFIAITAATAPLLGLLGTVSGMIRMFNVITVTGTGDVKPMAGGISEALVTTLFGLVVAIPALVMHAMLSRRSNGVVQESEKYGLTLVNGLRNREKQR